MSLNVRQARRRRRPPDSYRTESRPGSPSGQPAWGGGCDRIIFHLSWLRTAYSQLSRHDLKRYRQTANHFAVKLDAHFFVLLDGPRDNLLRHCMRYFIHAQVSAEIKPRSIRQNSEGAGVTDRHHIERSII